MAVKRQLKSIVPLKKEEAKTEKPVKEVKVTKLETSTEGSFEKNAAPRKRKFCQFCASKTEPKYWDASSLRRFLTDRGRIASRGRCGNCAKHQRRLAQEIKRARHLALLPFTVRI